MGVTELIVLAVALAVVFGGLLVGFLGRGRSKARGAPPGAATDAPAPRREPDAVQEPETPGTTATLDRPESTASRLQRLRARLAGSQGGLGRGLLSLLSRDRPHEDTWEST